eukprot:TRINITY_DN1791_c0_g1_i1.p1 TRINITY_DN1791_c0_g1~~TRINITY_DN1791_c0_g1_i1.p1  ORF type:complete len:236 (-),score=58.92 TRINITY_DN1791_c0_g1_i1:79-786(-)
MAEVQRGSLPFPPAETESERRLSQFGWVWKTLVGVAYLLSIICLIIPLTGVSYVTIKSCSTDLDGLGTTAVSIDMTLTAFTTVFKVNGQISKGTETSFSSLNSTLTNMAIDCPKTVRVTEALVITGLVFMVIGSIIVLLSFVIEVRTFVKRILFMSFGTCSTSVAFFMSIAAVAYYLNGPCVSDVNSAFGCTGKGYQPGTSSLFTGIAFQLVAVLLLLKVAPMLREMHYGREPSK